MFRYKVPNTIREVLMLDIENGTSYWADAIAKEMDGLNELDVFEFVDGNTEFHKQD